MRLCENGFNHLTDTLDLKSYEIDIRDVRINHKFLLELDKFMDSPYYILRGRWPKIYLFSEQTFFWLSMHNNNFDRFLKSYV